MEMTNINIRDLKHGMKNLNAVFIVLDSGRPTTTKDGHEVRTCKIADRTASINLSLWDEPGVYIQPGDICKLTKGYASFWKGCLTLYIGKGGEIHKIGEFCMTFSELPNMSEPSPEMMQQLAAKFAGGERRSPTPIAGPSGSMPSSSSMVMGGPGTSGTQPGNGRGTMNQRGGHRGHMYPNNNNPGRPSSNHNGMNNNNNSHGHKPRINRR